MKSKGKDVEVLLGRPLLRVVLRKREASLTPLGVGIDPTSKHLLLGDPWRS